ncbi:MAG TPA: hypothetical protein VFR34_01330, partial [Paracoccaceae bacterium]|nr:hypothetical protein [Paracoccaceae bacterium]
MIHAERFLGLTRLPAVPAAEILAAGRAKLRTRLAASPDAPAAAILAELDERGALHDEFRLLAYALPRREATRWACLAGRDILPEGAEWPTLAAAEAWVARPGREACEALRRALAAAGPDE